MTSSNQSKQALLVNGIHAITTHKVLSTEAEYAVYGVTAFAAASAAVASGVECRTHCYNATASHQNPPCDKFWLSLSISLTSFTIVPLLLMVMVNNIIPYR